MRRASTRSPGPVGHALLVRARDRDCARRRARSPRCRLDRGRRLRLARRRRGIRAVRGARQDAAGRRPLPAVVLLPTGLTLACLDRAQGAELRRLLLGEAAEGVREELGRTRLEREIGILYRDEEMHDRARKALAVHRAVARRRAEAATSLSTTPATPSAWRASRSSRRACASPCPPPGTLWRRGRGRPCTRVHTQRVRRPARR